MKPYKLTVLILIFVFGTASAIQADPDFNKSGGIIPDKDTAAVYAFTRKAITWLSKKGNVQTARAYIDSAESVCGKEGIELPDLLHLARAEYLFLINDYNNSSQEAALAMKLSKNNGNYKVQVSTLNFLGRYDLRTGFFKESIDRYEESIALANKYKLKGAPAKSYNGMADVFNTLGDLNKLRSTLQKLINAAGRERDTMGLKIGLFRLGSSLADKERNFIRADSMLRKCLEISMAKRDTEFIALSLANIGWNYYNEKKYDRAIQSYNQSIKYSPPSGKFSNSANAFGNLGTIYRDLGDTEKALKNYTKAIARAKPDNDVYTLYWVYNDMSEMYLRKRDTANAYKTYVLYKKYSDDYITMNNRQGLSEAKIRYDADSYSKEMQLLSLKLSNQKTLIYGYTALFILCLAIGILLYSRSRINAKRRISEMNRKISEITQANLRQQMNPHFIFNTLNSIQYYMYQHDKIATNNYLTKFSSLMRKVLDNSRHTSISLRDELEALNLYLELELIRFKDKFDYQIKVDEEIDTLLYKVPTMLIQPYVENSISHGLMPCEGKGLVKIDIKLENEYISCIIEDNGIGRDASRVKKINGMNGHNSLGTQIVESRLDLVNALYGTSLKTIYTDLKNINGEAEGTRVEIQIPILS